jgi:hypothetical protein
MLSERIANEIMTEIHELVKEFMSETIANRRSLSFDEIESHESELKESFGKRLSEGALEALCSGHVGQRISCKCGGFHSVSFNCRKLQLQPTLEACQFSLSGSRTDCGLLPCCRAALVVKSCRVWRRHKSLQRLGKKTTKASLQGEGVAGNRFSTGP